MPVFFQSSGFMAFGLQVKHFLREELSCSLMHVRCYKSNIDLKKLRPMILKRINNRAKDYPYKNMIPVAHKVLDDRKLLIEGVSTLLREVPSKACKYCPEVYIGARGHHIKSCHGFKRIKKDQEHKWINATINDILVPVEAFHLRTMFQPTIEHEQRFDFDRLPAVIELCHQAGAEIPQEIMYEHKQMSNSIGGHDQLDRVAQQTLDAWEGLRVGVQKLLFVYPAKVCEHCSEVHIGPSGHKARVCGVFRHEAWRGAHWWKKAGVDDLVPPNVVWHRRQQDPQVLVDDGRGFYGHAPAVVELCMQAGARVPKKYFCIEEYEEPPVFGKRTIFTSRLSGERNQWIQCDDCFKWRRLTMDFLVPTNWTCSDNIWDPKRSSCSVPEELSPSEMQNLLRQNAEIKMRMNSASSKQTPSELEVGGLDTVATAAAVGDTSNQATSSSAATTTKHPRHRPGCTCIVCIQPPSGKGPKHHPNCTCNVCETVKRRFKTLMMRKKKRQSEREEAEANKRLLPWGSKEEMEGSSTSLAGFQPLESQKDGEMVTEPARAIVDIDMGKVRIDLNFQPEREQEQHAVGHRSSSRVSMMSLLHVANLPLENYLKENGLTSLACEQQVSSGSVTVPQAMHVGESEERTPDEANGSTVLGPDGSGDEGRCSPDNDKSDKS